MGHQGSQEQVAHSCARSMVGHGSTSSILAWSRVLMGQRGKCRSYRASQMRVAVVRSYHQDYRRSHQNSQLKPVWAGLVLG